MKNEILTNIIKYKWHIAIGIAGLIFLRIIYGLAQDSVFTIDQGEGGVVLTNGEVSRTVSAGLHFKVPLFQDVVRINTRTRVQPYNKVAAYTFDKQTAYVKMSVTYSVDPRKIAYVYEHYGERSNNEAVAKVALNPIALSQFKEIFGLYDATNAIREKGKMSNQIQDALIKETKDTGLIIHSFQVENIDYTDKYEAASEDAAEAAAAVLTATNRLEEARQFAQQAIVKAEAAAQAQRAKADADAYEKKLNADAEAYKIEVEAKTMAHAMEIKGLALSKNPRLVDLNAVERWNGVLPATQVPGSTVPFINVK